jgi:hypothetical protein
MQFLKTINSCLFNLAVLHDNVGLIQVYPDTSLIDCISFRHIKAPVPDWSSRCKGVILHKYSTDLFQFEKQKRIGILFMFLRMKKLLLQTGKFRSSIHVRQNPRD